MVVQMGHHQRQNAGSVLQFQMDAAGDQILDTSGNPIPEMEDYVQEVGNLFIICHNLDRMEVLNVSHGAIMHQCNVSTGSKSASPFCLPIQNKSAACLIYAFGLSL